MEIIADFLEVVVSSSRESVSMQSQKPVTIKPAIIPWQEKCKIPVDYPAGEIARRSACEQFGLQITQLETNNNINFNNKVKEAVNALTSVSVEVGKNPKTGEPYYSGDFRDHPKFKKHFSVLTEAWGILPLDDPKRKTLEIIKILVAERKEASNWHWDFWEKDNYMVREVVWRQVDDIDIFMAGFVHTDVYYEKHRESYKAIAAQCAILAIEGHTRVPISEDLFEIWSSSNKYYGQFMHDAADINPSIVISVIDPRDGSKVLLENPLSKKNKDYFNAYFSYLSKAFPKLSKTKLMNPKILEKTIKLLSTTHLGILSRIVSINGSNDDIVYHPFPYIDENGNTRSNQTGLEFGECIYADAVMALKLRRLVQLQRTGKIPVGPIFDLEGATHIQGKRHFFDDPIIAYEAVILNLQYIHQSDILKDDASILTFKEISLLHDILKIMLLNSQDMKVVKMANNLLTKIEDKAEEEEIVDLINKEPLKTGFLLEKSRMIMDKVSQAFSIERMNQTFDWEFWENVVDDPWEMYFAKPNEKGVLLSFGFDFSGKEISH